MRRRLTNEEREIRESRGIPFSRWWPALMIIVAMIISSSHPALFERCLGNSLDGNGKGWAAVRLAATIPCSVFLLRGGLVDWLLFAAIWVPIPIAVLNYRWSKRHSLYWDKVRLREAQRRAEKRSERDLAEQATRSQDPLEEDVGARQKGLPRN